MRKRRVFRWMRTGLLAFAFVFAVNQYGFALSVVNGTSMEPTLEDGDRLFINRFAYLFNEPQVGDVITFEDPAQDGRYLVKRVVGVSGDRIEIRSGVLYRNGKAVPEPYIDTKIEDGNFGPVTVKPGTVFVLGDNRHKHASRDSRYESVGLVPIDRVDGKVEWIIWRPSLAAFL